MGGIHTVYRKTTDHNIIGVKSILTLPTGCEFRKNTVVGNSSYNGAFPEFFHGFYSTSSYGLDIGIIYKGDFNLFFYSFANTQSSQWFESTSFTVPNNRIIELESWFENGYLATRCRDSEGKDLKSLDVYLTPEAYESMSKNGCTVYREMCLAVNQDSNGQFNMPANCRFINAKWDKTILTSNSNEKINLTKYNSSNSENNALDSGMPSNVDSYYGKSIKAVMDSEFVVDMASATLDKLELPI